MTEQRRQSDGYGKAAVWLEVLAMLHDRLASFVAALQAPQPDWSFDEGSEAAARQQRRSSKGRENRGDGRENRGDGRLLISDALLDERRRHERQAALDKQHAASE